MQIWSRPNTQPAAFWVFFVKPRRRLTMFSPLSQRWRPVAGLRKRIQPLNGGGSNTDCISNKIIPPQSQPEASLLLAGQLAYAEDEWNSRAKSFKLAALVPTQHCICIFLQYILRLRDYAVWKSSTRCLLGFFMSFNHVCIPCWSLCVVLQQLYLKLIIGVYLGGDLKDLYYTHFLT